MAARHEQGQARVRQGTVLELVDSDVGRQVVHAVQRLAQRDRQRLRGGDADEERAGQARPSGHGQGVDVTETDPCRLAGSLDRGHHRLEVGAGGDLGHHAAVPCVLLHRGRDGIGEECVAPHDTDTGLVARGLDAQDERLVGHDAMMPRVG